MRRALILTMAILGASGVVRTAAAQKSAPAVTRDADRDGVPDIRDRCRNTPAATRVDERGCTLPAAPAAAPAAAAPAAAPTAVATQAAQARADSLARAARADSLARVARADSLARAARADSLARVARADSVARRARADSIARADSLARLARADSLARVRADSVARVARADSIARAGQRAAPQAAPGAGGAPAAGGAAVVAVPVPVGGGGGGGAQPAAPAAAAAGLGIEPYAGRSHADLLDYARRATIRIDSAIVSLRNTYANTSGQPLAGATAPSVLSSRERGRWSQCRVLYYDMQTLSDAALLLRDSLTTPVALGRASAALADAFEGLQALAECDNIGSMIEAPDRWAPWGPNYETAARNFYREWYPQARAVHEAARGLARQLNVVLPAARRFAVPPGLPPNPPYIGAAR